MYYKVDLAFVDKKETVSLLFVVFPEPVSFDNYRELIMMWLIFLCFCMSELN